MTVKKPWKVGPNKGERQAYVNRDYPGRPMIRQALRTEDGRILWFDLSPDECANLIADLESARRDADLDGSRNSDYPDARF